MFDFGFWELVAIGVVALLVVGPNRLPGLARQVGMWLGKTKRFVNSVRADIERELQSEELRRMLKEQQDEIRQLKGMISDTQAEVRAELRETGSLVKAIEEQAASDKQQPSARAIRNRTGAQAAPQPTGMTSDNDARRSAGS